MILHTLNQAPSSTDCMINCLNAMDTDDSLLLIENAVYAAIKSSTDTHSPQPHLLEKLSTNGRLFILANDFIARGLTPDIVLPGTHCIDYEEFVSLVCLNDKCVAWF